MASRVLETWVEETIEFDTVGEMQEYMEKNKRKSNPRKLIRMEDVLVDDVWKNRFVTRYKK